MNRQTITLHISCFAAASLFMVNWAIAQSPNGFEETPSISAPVVTESPPSETGCNYCIVQTALTFKFPESCDQEVSIDGVARCAQKCRAAGREHDAKALETQVASCIDYLHGPGTPVLATPPLDLRIQRYFDDERNRLSLLTLCDAALYRLKAAIAVSDDGPALDRAAGVGGPDEYVAFQDITARLLSCLNNPGTCSAPLMFGLADLASNPELFYAMSNSDGLVRWKFDLVIANVLLLVVQDDLKFCQDARDAGVNPLPKSGA